MPVEPYDLIYSFGVIHHTPHPEKVIQEIKKYCHPQTQVRIMLYSKFSWKVIWIILKYGKGAFWKLNELVRQYSEAQTGCPVTYTYTIRQVKKLLKDFDIIQIKKDFIFPYNIKKYINYEYEIVWYFKWMPRWLFKWLEKVLGWYILVIAKPK